MPIRRRYAKRRRGLVGLDRANAMTALLLPPVSDEAEVIEAYVRLYLELEDDLLAADPDARCWAWAVFEGGVEPELDEDPRRDEDRDEQEQAGAEARRTSRRRAELARAALRRLEGERRS